MRNFVVSLLLFLYRKDDFMMAMLWAQQIMMQESENDAKGMYARVPRLLKAKVRQILIDSGMGHLAE